MKGTDDSRIFRILLAGIQNLRCCPYPRCLVPLTQAGDVGKVKDLAAHTKLARKDDEA